MPAQLWQLKTGQDGKLLRCLPWCSNDLIRLWDRTEKMDEFANSVNPNEAALNESPHQSLQCFLPYLLILNMIYLSSGKTFLEIMQTYILSIAFLENWARLFKTNDVVS